MATPFNLATFGVTGCQVFISPCVSPCQPRVTTTGGGNAQRSEGSVIYSMPIPNNSFLRGRSVFFQSFFADNQVTGRVTRLTFTNALRVTFQ